jgi:ADP-ribose pyrophosphatase YjhB (NUDIX family)
MDDIAEDGVETPFSDDQDWRIAWCPPPDSPQGTRHGGNAICVAGDQMVLISHNGRRWGLPGGRPEADEDWIDTVRREIQEEACATATDCRLLGFTTGTCVRGREQGRVLVRSQWLAEVSVQPWDPQFEIPYRRLVPAAEAFAQLSIPPGQEPLYRRMFSEAGFPY